MAQPGKSGGWIGGMKAGYESMQKNAADRAKKKKDSLDFSAGDFTEIKDLVEVGDLTPEQQKTLKNKRLDKIAKAVTGRVQSRTQQLLVLDHRVLMSMNHEIVALIERSTGRFDDDEEKGLDEKEFNKFFASMVTKVDKIVSTYAPTAEEIAAIQESEKAMKEAKEAVENVEKIDLKKVRDDPGEIPDLRTLADRFEYYDAAQQQMREEGAKATKTFAHAVRTRATMIHQRSKLESRKKFRQYFGMKDPEMQAFYGLVIKARQTVKDTKQSMQDTADRLERYGDKMAEASNEQKRKLMEEERQGHLDRIDGYEQEGVQQTEEEKLRYRQLTAHKDALEANKADLEFYREMIVQDKKDEVDDRMIHAEIRKAQLQTHSEIVIGGKQRIDEALEAFDPNNKNLSEEQKAQKAALLLARGDLDIKEEGLQLAQLGIGAILGETQEDWDALIEDDRAIAEENYNTDLELQLVELDMQSIDAHLNVVNAGMMQYTNSRQEVIGYYAKVGETYDGIDEAIDTAIAYNNIATTQTLVDLDSQYNMLGSNMQIPDPGPWESTIGIPFTTLQGVAETGGEWILEESRELSGLLQKMDKESMGSAGYWARKIIVHPANTILSFAGAGLKMGGGLVGAAGSWENATTLANGISSMVGVDFKNGRYGLGVAGETIETMIVESIPHKDIENGYYDVAAGEFLFNLISTAVGGKAVGAAKKGAVKSSQKAMRQAIEGGQSAAGVLWAGASKGIAGGVQAGVGSLGGSALNAAETAAKGAKLVVGGGAKAIEFGVRGVTRRRGERKSRKEKVGKEGGKHLDEGGAIELIDADLIDVVDNGSPKSPPPLPKRKGEVEGKGAKNPKKKVGEHEKVEGKWEDSPIKGLIDETLGELDVELNNQIISDKAILNEVLLRNKDNPAKTAKLLEEAIGEKKNELTPVLDNLRSRDPEAYRLLEKTDYRLLVETDCLEPIISGRKLEKVSGNGEHITIYQGGHFGSGELSNVTEILYHKEGEASLHHGALKSPIESSNPKTKREIQITFEAEMERGHMLQEWNDPGIIRVEEIGSPSDPFLIYETGTNAVELHKAAYDFDMPVSDVLNSVQEVLATESRIRERGHFEPDINEGNILILTDEAGNITTKMIDLSPNPLSERGGGNVRSKHYSFTPEEMQAAADNLGAYDYGIAYEDIPAHLSRAQDTKAMVHILENVVDEYAGLNIDGLSLSPKQKKIIANIEYIFEQATDPITAGDPQMFGKIEKTLQRLKQEAKACEADPSRASFFNGHNPPPTAQAASAA